MLYYLVAYDIPDDTTRKQIGDLLEAHGLRVQRSLFELRFKHRRELLALQKSIRMLIDPEADSVRFYAQCSSCRAKANELGNFPDPFAREAIFFF